MRRNSCLVLLFALLLTVGCQGGETSSREGDAVASSDQAVPPGTPETDDEKAFYAYGFMMGGNLKNSNLSDRELEVLRQGIQDAAKSGEAAVDVQVYGPRMTEVVQKRTQASATATKEGAAAFQEKAAAEEGALQTDSGLIYRTITPGEGASPRASDVVKVHYVGKLTDGTVFDSSVARGQPAEFSLSGVIPCWTEAVQKMKLGEKAEIVCPSDIAYGDQGRPPTIPGGATLIFEVELLEVKGS